MPFRLAQKMDDTLRIVARGEDEPRVINYFEVAEHYRGLVQQLLVSGLVDRFLTYIARLLASIFTQRPATLRSGAQVRVDYIMDHSSIEDLLRSLADDEVNRLAYTGMKDLHSELERRLGFRLFLDKDALATASLAVELRNLIVHNDGVVNRVFLHRLPSYPATLGEQVVIDRSLDAPTFLAHAVHDIDSRAQQKFDLPLDTRPHPARMCHRV